MNAIPSTRPPRIRHLGALDALTAFARGHQTGDPDFTKSGLTIFQHLGTSHDAPKASQGDKAIRVGDLVPLAVAHRAR
jgi:hypothetical protein